MVTPGQPRSPPRRGLRLPLMRAVWGSTPQLCAQKVCLSDLDRQLSPPLRVNLRIDIEDQLVVVSAQLYDLERSGVYIGPFSD
jgi:hypothetical protein